MYPLNQKKPLHIFLYKNAEYKKKARNYTWTNQGTYATNVNCGRVYSAYILKPVLFGRTLCKQE